MILNAFFGVLQTGHLSGPSPSPVIPQTGQGDAWTAEEWQIAYQRFNIFALMPKTSGFDRMISALWSTVLMILLQRGLTKLGDAVFNPNPNVIGALEAKIKLDQASPQDKMDYLGLTNQLDDLWTGGLEELARIKDKLKKLYTTGGTKQQFEALRVQWKSYLTNNIEAQITARLGALNVQLATPLAYKIIYGFKQFWGGLMSPTEWVEGLYYWKTGSMFQINNKVGGYFWNYFDNVAFTVFQDDSTWGMIKALWYGAQGDYSHFTQYWSFSSDEFLSVALFPVSLDWLV